VIGNDMRNSFELASITWPQDGGLPVEVIYEDDGQKPDVGKQKTEKLIQSDKVDFIAGYIWSKRAVGLAQDRGRCQDLPDSAPTPDRRSSPVSCARPMCSRPRGRTTRPRRPWAST